MSHTTVRYSQSATDLRQTNFNSGYVTLDQGHTALGGFKLNLSLFAIVLKDIHVMYSKSHQTFISLININVSKSLICCQRILYTEYMSKYSIINMRYVLGDINDY